MVRGRSHGLRAALLGAGVAIACSTSMTCSASACCGNLAHNGFFTLDIWLVSRVVVAEAGDRRPTGSHPKSLVRLQPDER
jgi:hypothetical protein